jgi:hypothetical protein
MMSSIADVIATRTLQIVDGAGKPSYDVRIVLGRPLEESSGEWSCPYQIVGLGDGAVRRVSGLDAIQSLQSAMLVIGGYLQGTEHAEQGRLLWAGERELGFPKVG